MASIFFGDPFTLSLDTFEGGEYYTGTLFANKLGFLIFSTTFLVITGVV
jgi:hypothetical protein